MNQLNALIAGSIIAAFSTIGCWDGALHDAAADDDDGCSEPHPAASGWCPPAYTCIDGQWVDTAGNCEDPCPEFLPMQGDDCSAIGATCAYEEYEMCGDGSTTVTAECTADGWQTYWPRCMPEPECPEAAPVDGSDCSGWEDAYYCDYSVETACGEKGAGAYCDYQNGQAIWSVELYESCDTCAEHDSSVSCSANSACRWLEPGCGDPAIAEAGCFPADDCVQGGCEGEQTCTTVVVDPCWNSLCNACAADAQVCL